MNNTIYIKEKNKRYILSEVANNIEAEEINNIIKSNNLQDRYYKIIETIDGNTSINYKNRNYILMNIELKAMTVGDRILEQGHMISSVKNYNLDRSNWFLMWCRKNDYIKHQYKFLKGKNRLVDESIDYFIGMAETAIAYLQEIPLQDLIKKEQLYISHRRIHPDQYYNPLNIVIDRQERDVSEYIKYMFFKGELTENIIEKIVEQINEENISPERVYARLLYPTYYFDIYDHTEISELFSSQIKDIVSKMDDYELLLVKLNKIFNIKKIDWL